MSTGQVLGGVTVTHLMAVTPFARCKSKGSQAARNFPKPRRGHWAWLLVLVLGTRMSIAASGKIWSLEELKARGQEVFLANCAVCHQAGGEGIPGTFPPLKGSKITTGPIDAHMDIVIHGSKKNPTMPAWGKQLSDLDLASVITYERNAWGNNTGDVIEPNDVRAAR